MQLIVQKKGYRILPLLALAVAMAVLVFIARDTQAVHAEAILELDTAVGPIVVDAIRANRFYIFTHPDSVALVRARQQHVLDDFEFYRTRS